MTASMKGLGGMLGVANGAVKIDKSFCMQAKAVTRAEMAAYYTANSIPPRPNRMPIVQLSI